MSKIYFQPYYRNFNDFQPSSAFTAKMCCLSINILKISFHITKERIVKD